MRPTLRAVLIFAISVPLALLIISAWSKFWHLSLCLPVMTLAFIAADSVSMLQGNCLLIIPNAPKRLCVGQSGAVEFAISVENYTRLLSVQSLLELTGEAETTGIITQNMVAGQLSINFMIVPRLRGQVTINALWLRWRGPFGLVEATIRRPVESVIDIIPDVKGIHETALQFFSREAIYGVKTQRPKGEGTEFENLTEYAPGMDSRMIDWKRSAGHRKLLCKEFKQERNHQIVLGFDTGRLMLEPVYEMPKLDHAIKAGLLLSWISLRSGDLVGGCSFDASFNGFIKPGRGMSYFTKVQHFTAGLSYRTEETNFTLGLMELNSKLQRRALVIIFTDFVDLISAELLIESLQIMRRRHVVIFVTLRDPLLARLQSAPPDDFQNIAEAVIADDFIRERSIVLDRIVRLGVHCLDVPIKSVSSALINRYLMIKQRGLL